MRSSGPHRDRRPSSDGFERVLTPRLQLDAVVPGDLEEHVTLMSDPGAGRICRPAGTLDPATTADGIRHSVGHWERDGLGYWTARLREELPEAGLTAGTMVGTGGCAVRVGTTWWNLYYRLTPRAWGRGLAAEMVTASLDAAHAVDPDRPVIAYLVEHNLRSRGRAERSGLSLRLARTRRGQPRPGRRPAGLRRPAAGHRVLGSVTHDGPDQSPGTSKAVRDTAVPAASSANDRASSNTATAPVGKPACRSSRGGGIAVAVVQRERELADRRVVADDDQGRHVSGRLRDRREHGVDRVDVDPLVERRGQIGAQRGRRPLPGLRGAERR